MCAFAEAGADASDPPPAARLLVSYGEDLASSGAAQVGDAFTDDPEADALIKADPNAFLLGVLFTQGIPAERAWAGPWRLAQRLGHLDLARLAAEPEAVEAAFAARPVSPPFQAHAAALGLRRPPRSCWPSMEGTRLASGRAAPASST